MFEVLVGNKTVEKILLFLFVNGKCYGTQMHRLLQMPLTPIQNALFRLEKGGLIISYLEGKTRIYQFNPAFPLLSEVEDLLKKAYTLLPPHEKKDYYVAKEDLKPSENKVETLFVFWDRLSKVSELRFKSKTREWNRKGKGEVLVSKDQKGLIFHERGNWLNEQGEEVNFSNVFRWSFDRSAALITLEHLRFGLDQPVFLFHLAPTSRHSLTSVDSHLCGGDTYFGKIHLDRYGLSLSWRVIGPKKNEEIEYIYV